MPMHKQIDVVRAWRDEDYRNSLTAEELSRLPESPAGFATVDDTALRSVAGGALSANGNPHCTTIAFSCVKPGQNCP
jgi:mersacidin/lichenicidin family type 2 lantibiotic